MKDQKSYDVGLKVKGHNIEEYLVLPKIEVIDIVEENWIGDDFHLSLPSDKHGVYVVFENDKCLYVGETKNQKGFKGRFEGHHYLREFRTNATKIILYIIDKEKHNDRVLFEKLKIKELNPILNRTERREDSIKYSLNVIEGIKQDINELIDIFGQGTNIDQKELEKDVIKNFRTIHEILDQIDPEKYVYGNKSQHVSGSGLNPQLNYTSIKVIDCVMCNGEKECRVCGGNGKLVVEEVCNDCDGIGYREGSNDKGYCSICKGTGYSVFTVFEKNNHTKLFLESCSTCDNTGEDVSEEVCEVCNGKRYIIVEEELKK